QTWDGAHPIERAFDSGTLERRAWDKRGSLLSTEVSVPCTPHPTATCPCDADHTCVDGACLPTGCQSTADRHVPWSEAWPRYASGNILARDQTSDDGALDHREIYGYDARDHLTRRALGGALPVDLFVQHDEVSVSPDFLYPRDDGGNTVT